MSDALDRLVRESRSELGARESRDVDWSKVDGALFRRIDVERRAERSELTSGRAGRWALVAAVAMAAVGGLSVGASRGKPAAGGAQAAVEDSADVVAVEGGGQLLVGGKPVGVGASLHVGDVIDARGARATVERPGKLTLVFERGAKATITRVQGMLLLALQEGAVEAQVVPVPSGEAFAVDVGRTRVAVHGTHLRVARVGDHVVVDLNEGVVSLGDAPRIGSTLGALVTAPAHAEFTTNDAEGTLAVTHDPAGVRPPVSLGSSPQAHGAAPSFARPLSSPRAEQEDARPSGIPPHPEARAGAAGARTIPSVEVSPEVAIGSAVRSCLAERPRADNVTVVVSTTVHLALGSDGTVISARFDPPVAPDVNACASSAIYRARFSHAGTADIPVDFTLPSSAP